MKLLFAAILVILFGTCSPKQEQSNTANTVVASTTGKNKELIKRVYTELVSKQNYALVDSFFALNVFDHGALEGQQQGREGFKKAVTEFLGMFSQIEVKQEGMLADGDKVATRETWKMVMASTDKVLTGETMHWFRIKDGLITDEWSKGWEFLGL